MDIWGGRPRGRTERLGSNNFWFSSHRRADPTTALWPQTQTFQSFSRPNLKVRALPGSAEVENDSTRKLNEQLMMKPPHDLTKQEDLREMVQILQETSKGQSRPLLSSSKDADNPFMPQTFLLAVVPSSLSSLASSPSSSILLQLHLLSQMLRPSLPPSSDSQTRNSTRTLTDKSPSRGVDSTPIRVSSNPSLNSQTRVSLLPSLIRYE